MPAVMSGFLAVGLLLLGPGAPARGEGTPKAFVAEDLRVHLAGNPSPDWNRVASLTFPLALQTQEQTQDGNDAVRAVLAAVAQALGGLEPARLSCADAVNAALTSGFLADAGHPAPVAALRGRLVGCTEHATPFDTVNTLLFQCRYGQQHQPIVQAMVRQVVDLQRPDGRFAFPGVPLLPGYYLTSHAIVALQVCGSAEGAVARGQAYLRSTLEPFRVQGFLDGLAESLIFLAWTGASGPEWPAYVAFLRARILPDGGVCFADRPACRGHWHTTSLMAEVERLDHLPRTSGVLPRSPFA
ncbi:MAG: hypothetical protein FD149_1962, partial [Rhodospirillaceae bacterium]